MTKQHTYPPADELNLKMVIAILRAAKELELKVTPCFKNSCVTFAQFGVLEFLYHKGPARISTIIEKTLSSGGNMTVVIRNLGKMGLVSRRPDALDGRASLIGLTPRGEALMKKLFPGHLLLLREFLAALPEGEKEALIGSLRGLPGRELLGTRSCRAG